MDSLMSLRERLPSMAGRDIGCWLCYQSRRLWVPTDIWEDILGMFKDQLEVMAVCGRVCMAWRAITTRYTHEDLDRYETLRSLTEVLRFSQLSRVGTLHSMESVTVSGSISDSRTNRSLAHVARFAAMLAGNVPRALSELRLKYGEWPAGIPRSVFLHLTTFTPITKLTLISVEFPSIGVFDRLVCALSHLEQLDLFTVSFRDASALDPRSIFSHLTAPITELTLNRVELPANGIFDRLVCSLSHLEKLDLFSVSFGDASTLDPRSIFSHLATPITKLTLRICHVEFPSIGVFDQLVCALSHLGKLHLSGVSFRDASALDPRSIFSHPAAPITELRFNRVELPANGIFDRLVYALSHLDQLHLSSVSFRDAEASDPRSVFSHLAAPITKLTLDKIEFPSIGLFDRLVCALSHLEQLHLNDVSFSDVQAPAPLGRHWNTPPHLHQIWVDQSPSYLASHMFRALPANKTIACCHQLVSCLGRGSGILLDSVKDISLQQVLDCAGDSLQTLKLGLLLPSPNPGLGRAGIERLVDTCVNISHNTSLRSLEIRTSLRGLRTNPNHLIWIPRLISHVSVASVEDISVHLSVDSQDNINRQRFDRDFMGLLESLHKWASLDDMLSAPDYTSLKEVAFCILLPPKCGWDPYKWTESLSEIFPKLAARRILRCEDRSDIQEEDEDEDEDEEW